MTFGYESPSDPFIQDIMDELAVVYDVDDEPPAPRPSPSALAAQKRREDADRQRRRRAEMRDTGVPDGRTVDTAVSAAVTEVLTRIGTRAHIKQTGGLDDLHAPVKNILARAKDLLVDKGYDKKVAARALHDRLLPST